MSCGLDLKWQILLFDLRIFLVLHIDYQELSAGYKICLVESTQLFFLSRMETYELLQQLLWTFADTNEPFPTIVEGIHSLSYPDLDFVFILIFRVSFYFDIIDILRKKGNIDNILFKS